MNFLRLVSDWVASSGTPLETGLPPAFLRCAFEINNFGLYTKDAVTPGTAAGEIVRATLKHLNIGLNPERGEATDRRTIFNRVWEQPKRSFIVNNQGGVAIFTELATPSQPDELTACMIITQATQAADHLLEAHEYEPIFALTGRHKKGADGELLLVVRSLHQQTDEIIPTLINTKLALCYADLCFAQVLAGERIDAEAALKAADQLSLGELDDRFSKMKSRHYYSSAKDYPAIRPVTSQEFK